MARKPRIHYEGALYHVICRGNNKEYIFKEDSDKDKYIELLRNYKKRYNFKIYAYCIMGNHVHMLIETGQVPLSKIMQGVQQVYTYYFNKKENRSGHVFEQRYKASLCDKDKYLLALIRYIHQNPVRAEIEKGLNYKYSSHKNYITANGEKLVSTEFPLSLFGKNTTHQLKEYLEFVGEKENEIQKLNKDKLMPEIKEDETKEKEEEKKYTIEEIIDMVCDYYDITQEEICLKIRTKRLVTARKTIIYMAKKYSDVSNKELSYLLNIAQSTISNIIADKELKEEKDFYKIIKV